MSRHVDDFLAIPSGYRSHDAASFMAQLDDLRRLQLRDLEGITPAELERQVTPGTNTIGMLLAHHAIVESFWTQIGLMRIAPTDLRQELGIGDEDDGMPIPAGGAPPAVLAGKDLAFFGDLIGRGREYLRSAVRTIDGAALREPLSRTRLNGDTQAFDRHWVLYHLVEHFAGHYGQILLLRHLHRGG